MLSSFILGLHLYIILEFMLKFNGGQTEPTVTSTYITVVGGAVITYLISNVALKANVNKHGITVIPSKKNKEDIDG